MKRPNVVLISIDSLRDDHLSCYGYARPTTPNIDDFAKQSVLFRTSYSTAAWTPPAHASMLTGLYPSQHGVVDNKKRSPQTATIASTLASHGYTTVGFVNNPQVGAYVGLDDGHGDFYEPWMGVTSTNLITRAAHFAYRTGKTLIGSIDHGASKTNDLIKTWLRNRVEKASPFYMFIHYIDAHNPFAAPRPFNTMFLDSQKSSSIDKKKMALVLDNPLVCYTDDFNLNEDEIAYLTSAYDAEIAYTDHIIGELFGEFDKRRLLDDTLIILTADHGEHLGEHGHFSHVSSLYEPIVRVPMIIRYPRVFKPGMDFMNPVQHVDIFPTIMEFLDLDYQALKLPGKSLLSKSGKIQIEAERPVVAEWEGRIPEYVKDRLSARNGHGEQTSKRFTRKSTMVRSGNYKLIFHEDGENELYDLALDAAELKNIAGDHPEVCRNLKNMFEKIRAIHDSEKANEERQMNDAVRERLQGLGYL